VHGFAASRAQAIRESSWQSACNLRPLLSLPAPGFVPKVTLLLLPIFETLSTCRAGTTIIPAIEIGNSSSNAFALSCGNDELAVLPRYVSAQLPDCF